MKKFTKLFVTKPASIDEEAKTVRFKISDNTADRYGEVVDQSTWNFKNFMKNPIVLWGHDPDEPENCLGTADEIEVAADGSATYATLRFDTEINKRAALIFEQIKKSTLRCVSVGFINHSYEVEQDVPVLRDNELVEISVVPIPANANAIALSLKDGSLNRKDAQWLMDSMKREVAFIEQQIESDVNKEKSMTEEQFNALVSTIEGVSAKIDANKAEADAAIEELKSRLPEPETEEAKAEREAKEAEDAKAAEEEAARVKAEEEQAAADAAKSGSDDQDGAADDVEFDEDAELTPELQAELDAAFEEVEV